ncbi:LOW QUALITY PROTEIN: MORN repeat-containing protein 1 [Cariama cristata]
MIVTCKTSIVVELTNCYEGWDKLFCKDGSYSEGKFINGVIIGNGCQYWALTAERSSLIKDVPVNCSRKKVSAVSVYSCTGNSYTSQFVFGELHGHKVLQYKDGGKYERELFYGMREGTSIIMKEPGLDKCQGHGTLASAVGTEYEGQWRNDVFNEGGAIVNCSGDICDGLWINGYPAACGSFGRNHGGAGVSVQPMKRTTVEQILALQPMEPHARAGGYFLKELQPVESPSKTVNSCGLEIWAAIRNHRIPSSSATNLFELIEETERKTIKSCVRSVGKSQFYYIFHLINMYLKTYQHKQRKMSKLFSLTGFECISYLLTYVTSGNWELRSTVSVISNSGFALADLSIPIEIEPESGSDTLYGAGDASSSQHALKNQCMQWLNGGILHEHRDASKFSKGGKKPSGRISAEKAEKMTVSQEKMEDSSFSIHILNTIFNSVPLQDSCSLPLTIILRVDKHYGVMQSAEAASEVMSHDIQRIQATKGSAPHKEFQTLQGQYVLMVHEVTMPPFLGQTLPPAFKLLIFPEKTKTKNKDYLKVTSK